MRRLLPVVAISLLAIGCQSVDSAIEAENATVDTAVRTAAAGPIVHPDSVSEKDAALLGEISKLAGEWEMPGEDGEKFVSAIFATIANGSAVREIMFPGTNNEMTNLYHMDGGVLVCTHYCAAMNQPRMIASESTKTDEGTVFKFDMESVSNLRQSHDHYMGNLTVTILDDGTLRQDWRSYDREGKLGDPMTFVLTRKGS